jgi:ZIP family zinc transporter
MSGFWQVLLLSLLPGAGNFAGGLLAEYTSPSPRHLNWALHVASGIVIAIVAVELIPQALGAIAGWWIAGAFAAGGCAYVLLERLIYSVQNRAANNGGSSGSGRMWMIYFAVAIDLTSDGLMLGTGAAVASSLALALAAGQVIADVPEGYATVANFRDKGVPRSRRLMLSLSFFLFVVGAALLSYFLLRGASELVKNGALTFVAGLLTVAAVEDMLEEAHSSKGDTSWSVLWFVAGFALFTLVSAGLETLTGS